MSIEENVLKELIGIFPNEGHVVPYIELKFRLASQCSPKELEKFLDKLIENDILTRYEFNNTVHYKSKTDIPLSLGGKPASPEETTMSSTTPTFNGADQLAALSKIVIELVKNVDNVNLNSLIENYKKDFKL